MYTIAIANQKGGVAKTTTCAAMASVLSRKGYRVLTADMDPQGNLTGNVGVQPGERGVYRILRNEGTVSSEAVKAARYDILPSTILLTTLASEMKDNLGSEFRLRSALRSAEKDYDFCLLDCPPAFGQMTASALIACNHLIIPFEADRNSLVGIKELEANTIAPVRSYYNPDMKVSLLQTKCNPQLRITREATKLSEMISEMYQWPLYATRIRNCVSVKDADFSSIDLYDYAPNSTVAKDYWVFTEEFLETL